MTSDVCIPENPTGQAFGLDTSLRISLAFCRPNKKKKLMNKLISYIIIACFTTIAVSMAGPEKEAIKAKETAAQKLREESEHPFAEQTKRVGNRSAASGPRSTGAD